MRATHAHGFLPFKVSLPCGSNDDIQGFSPENRGRVPAAVLARDGFFRLLPVCRAVSNENPNEVSEEGKNCSLHFSPLEFLHLMKQAAVRKGEG